MNIISWNVNGIRAVVKNVENSFDISILVKSQIIANNLTFETTSLVCSILWNGSWEHLLSTGSSVQYFSTTYTIGIQSENLLTLCLLFKICTYSGSEYWIICELRNQDRKLVEWKTQIRKKELPKALPSAMDRPKFPL